MRIPLLNRFTCNTRQLDNYITNFRNKNIKTIISYINENPKDKLKNFSENKRILTKLQNNTIALKLSSLDVYNNFNETIEVFVGDYTLDVTKPWYYSKSTSINVSNNETTVVKLSLVNGREDLLKIQKQKKKWLYGAMATTGIAAISYLVSNMSYNQYNDANNAQDATDFRKQTELFTGLAIASALVSTTSWGNKISKDGAEVSLKKELSLSD